MSFFRILFLLFLGIPILEIYLLLKVGGSIGALPTVALVVLTAVVGVWLLRLQGYITIARMQNSLNRGELPAETMLEGVMLFVAGALLLTPGFFTDAIGFLLLIPVTRGWIARFMLRRMMVMSQFQARHTSQSGQTYQSSATDVIEGEFISHDDKKH